MYLCIFSYDLLWIMNELLFLTHHMLLKIENSILYVWGIKKITSF